MRILVNLNQPNIAFNSGKDNSLPVLDNASAQVSQAAEVINKQTGYKSGSSVAIVALATVCSLFMFSKGFQNGSNKFLNKLKDYLEAKSAHSSIKDSEKWKKMYEFFIRRVNSFINKSESINNITSLKDVLFMRFMYKTEPTKKIHQAITKYFEKISQKTVYDSYEKTGKNFDRMCKIFDELDEYILKNSPDEKFMYDGKEITKRELIEKARSDRELSKMSVDAFIGKEAIKTRYDHIKKVTSSLYSDFWDASFKDFWSANNRFGRKEMWQTFIAAEQTKENKTDMVKIISIVKNAITYTKVEEVNKIYGYIKAIDNIIPAGDKEGLEIIKKLEWVIKNPDVFQANKDLFNIQLNKLRTHRIPHRSAKTEEALESYKKEYIDSIDFQINENKPGFLEDMLAIYYKVAPFELEDKGALLALKKAVTSFDESVNTECVEFFDKVRDLQLGSAPTDVLTILLSFITLSYGFGQAKDKDVRKSIMLKSGIPIVGGITTSVYSATKLVSGGKSLALGFLSAIILNRLGVIADNMRKKGN